MAEEFLEEQLKRIRQMAEQMSRVRPLYGMHELRNYSADTNGPAHEDTPPARKHPARGTSRRRGR